MQLVIGNKNYSTWSLRPWLMLDAFEVEFEEVLVSLKDDGLSERLGQYSQSKRVPVLLDGDLTVWDSLAICEYVSETYLAGGGWPQGLGATKSERVASRATARAITAEMHSGFAALRNEMPMNCRASRQLEVSDAALNDIRRIEAIWARYARKDPKGDIRLFGEFSIADCFFAPVAMRFITYGIELSAPANDYLNSLRAHPSLEKWVVGALQETEIIPQDEAGAERV